MYLVDTNVLSELRRPTRSHARVSRWADSVATGDLYVSAITVLEIEIGCLSISRRDKVQGALLRDWIDAQVMPGFEGRILPVDVAVARRCAQLHVPDRRSDRDALIGATALVHGLTVVTRNTADFEPMGVLLVNPWN